MDNFIWTDNRPNDFMVALNDRTGANSKIIYTDAMKTP